MAEDTQGKQEFDVEELIAQLGRKEFSPAHQEELEAGKDPTPKEIENRVGALTTRVGLFEMKNEDPAKINDLKKRGVEKLVKRFPEKKDFILDLLRSDKKDRYQEQIQHWEETQS